LITFAVMENESFKNIVERKSEVEWTKSLPSISIDCVVFGFNAGALKVLLLKIKDQDLWSLPGGYVGKQEDIDAAAKRILFQRSGAQNIFLQQFGVFAELNRSEGFFAEFEDTLWHKQRFVSLGFYALVDFTDVIPVVDDVSSDIEWRDIDDIPALMMDHRKIFDEALLTLRRQLNYKPIGYNLLQEEFTMPELQRLYEIILDKKLNRGNFYRKMIAYDILDKMDEPRKAGGAHKAPNLYKFNTEKYQAALENGLKEGW